MESKIYKVTAKSETTTISAGGKEMPRCAITLQEPGKFGDTVMAVMLGEECGTDIRVGDIVSAALRLSVHDFEGRLYQDILVRSIVKLVPRIEF